MNASTCGHQLITASAGSGKTHQLTSRLLRLLDAGAPGRRVLASTFTRKAAGEIRGRLMQRVARAAAGNERDLADLRAPHGLGQPDFSVAKAQALLRVLASGLGRQSVATLDSVLAGWTLALAPELGLEGVRTIVDENNPQARRLRAKALLRALHAVEAQVQAEGLGRLVLLDLLERLHHGEGKRSVLGTLDRALAGDLLGLYIEQPAKAAWSIGPAPGCVMTPEDRLRWVDQAQAAARELPKKKDGTPDGRVAKVWQTLVENLRADAVEDAFKSSLMQACKEDPMAVTCYNQPIENGPLALLCQACDHALATLHQKEQHRLDATFTLLAAFDHCHQQAKKEAGVLCFSDLPRMLAEGADGGALGDGQWLTELAYRLDGRVDHVLLDEFQDTSRQQWAVLRPLAEEVMAAETDRSLMVVGDPKQAIYAWRGGCSELMDDLRQRFAAQDPQSVRVLAQSFRSSPVVLGLVNDLFGAVADLACAQEPALRAAAQKFQALFTPHTAFKTELPGRVRLYESAPAEGEKPSADDKREAHLAQVADQVAALAAENPAASIGILVRSRKVGAPLLRLLHARDLPVSDEGGIRIGDHPAVGHVLALLRLAELPDDRAARAVVARGPLTAGYGADAVAQVRAGLRQLGLAGFVGQVAAQLAPACDALAARRLRQLQALAQELEAGDPDAARLPGSLAAKVALARVPEPGGGLISLMTIHGSKGLEFDLVVLPELDERLDESDARGQSVVLRQRPADPPARVMRRLSKELRDLTPESTLAHAAQAEQDRYEDLCLLYVAMTRAKQGLELVLMPQASKAAAGKKATAPKVPAYAQLLREACDVGESSDAAAPSGRLRLLHQRGGSDLAVAKVADAPVVAAKPLRIQWKKEAAAPRFLSPASPSGQSATEMSAADWLAGFSGGGAAFGARVHALCERVGFVDEEDWPLAKLTQTATELGLDEAGAVAGAVAALLDGPAAAWLARGGATELKREWSFLWRQEAQLVGGCFDRVHLWRDGAGQVVRARIVDFKTDRLDLPGLSVAQAQMERAAHHRPQLAAYRQALVQLTGCPEAAIECVVLFTASGDGQGV